MLQTILLNLESEMKFFVSFLTGSVSWYWFSWAYVIWYQISNEKNQLNLRFLSCFQKFFSRMFTLMSPSCGSRFRLQWLTINFSSTGKKKAENLPLCKKETNTTKNPNKKTMLHGSYPISLQIHLSKFTLDILSWNCLNISYI